MFRSRLSLAAQVALLTAVAAVLAVGVGFAVSTRVVRDSARTQARSTLGHYADLVSDGELGTGVGGLLRLAPRQHAARTLFAAADITPLRVTTVGGVVGTAPAPLPASVSAAARTGSVLDETVELAGTSYLLASRPAANGSGSIVLLQPASVAGRISTPLQDRLLLSLGIGLLVALVAGALASRRLARPLVDAAAAAGRLAAGERDVVLDPGGPGELAAVGRSLNELTEALGTSEARQRDFLLSVSHELRTPLTAIAGYAEAIEDGLVIDDELPGVGRVLGQETARLRRLVDDLLALARAEADDFTLQLEPVDLASLVAGAAQTWRPRVQAAGVSLSVELPPVAVVVASDATRLRQILDGLAENALRVTPAGRGIVFAVGLDGESGDDATLQVRDGGPGLTDDDLRVAFEPSVLHDRYQGSRRVGTGLGLALIARLAQRLGGRASAGHAAEGGAAFTVVIPYRP